MSSSFLILLFSLSLLKQAIGNTECRDHEQCIGDTVTESTDSIVYSAYRACYNGQHINEGNKSASISCSASHSCKSAQLLIKSGKYGLLDKSC